MADVAEPLAARHLIALGDGDGTPPQVAILGLPTARMVDDDAVAAINVAAAPQRRVRHAVGHAVADGADRPRRRGDHVDAVGHGGAVANRDVGSLMAVVGMTAAAVIADPLAGVEIDKIDQPARVPGHAPDRQVEFRRRRLLGAGGGGEKRHRRKDKRSSLELFQQDNPDRYSRRHLG